MLNRHQLNRAAFLTALVAFQPMLALGQDAAPAKSPAPLAPSNEAFTFYSSGLKNLLVDPKDQSLLELLELVDDRLRELPHELNEPGMPAGAIDLAMDLFTRPLQIHAGLLENLDAVPQDRPPFWLQLSFAANDAQEAQQLAGRFSATLATIAPQMARQSHAVENMAGLQTLDLHGTPLFYGAQTTQAGGGSTFMIAINRIDPAPIAAPATALPQPMPPALALQLNFQKLQPLLEKFLPSTAGAQDPADAIRDQLRRMRLIGPDAAIINSAIGFAPDRAIGAARLANYGAALREMNAIAKQPLQLSDLRRIPADATFAQISKFNLKSIGQMRPHVEGQPDPMASIEAMTGINPSRDILNNLGETVGVYTSDSTGAGGLLSGVFFVEVTNPEALQQTITKLIASFNQVGTFAGKGYVRLAERTINNQRMTTLTFPGIPVPLEMSFTQANGYLYAAMSPQSLLTAIAQGQGERPGLTENPHFNEMGGKELANAFKLTFLDTPRLIHDGYSLTSLAMAALSNAVRSPGHPDRGAEFVMPSLSDMVRNAKATVSIKRIEGNDIMITTQTDRSFLVNATGAAGILKGAIGPLMGVVMPAINKAREQAGHSQQNRHAHPHQEED